MPSMSLSRADVALARTLKLPNARRIYCGAFLRSCSTFRDQQVICPARLRTRRFASTLASSTAINATKDVPPNFGPLHKALDLLKSEAPNYVDLSRLQLAQRGLESQSPTIRLAILGLQSPNVAKRLARLLIADPLDNLQPWETELASSGPDDQRTLLIRNGDPSDPTSSNTALPTLHVSSRTLERYNFEILVSTLDAPSAISNPKEMLRDAVLVPLVAVPMSFSGSVSMIRHPVHRAIVVADGLDGCMSLGQWAGGSKPAENDTDNPVKFLLNFDGSINGSEPKADRSPMSVTNISLAEKSLDLFRQSNQNSQMFGRGWSQSGLPDLNAWIQRGCEQTPGKLRPAVQSLIQDVVDRTSIETAEDTSISDQAGQKATMSQEAQELNDSLTDWAARGHGELRESLDLAFTGLEWAKLSWWKLLWRADDVTMIASQLLARHWLVGAEKGTIWLAGRASQAGFADQDNTFSFASRAPEEQPAMEAGSNQGNAEFVETQRGPMPMEDSRLFGVQAGLISRARARLSDETVPTIQAVAQSAVLQAISLTTVSSALSVLIYLSLPAVSMYSAGAAGTLGIVWALRRLQKQWEGCKKQWEGQVREAGRLSLKMTEESFRGRIAEGAQSKAGQLSRNYEAQDIELAKRAVQEARDAVRDLVDKKARR